MIEEKMKQWWRKEVSTNGMMNMGLQMEFLFGITDGAGCSSSFCGD